MKSKRGDMGKGKTDTTTEKNVAHLNSKKCSQACKGRIKTIALIIVLVISVLASAYYTYDFFRVNSICAKLNNFNEAWNIRFPNGDMLKGTDIKASYDILPVKLKTEYNFSKFVQSKIAFKLNLIEVSKPIEGEFEDSEEIELIRPRDAVAGTNNIDLKKIARGVEIVE